MVHVVMLLSESIAAMTAPRPLIHTTALGGALVPFGVASTAPRSTTDVVISVTSDTDASPVSERGALRFGPFAHAFWSYGATYPVGPP
jgi:hypothetical protein